MSGNLLVLQSGGPTPVLNTSLYAVIDEARKHEQFQKLFGARRGLEGLLKSDFADITNVPDTTLARLKQTPGAALGTTRYKPQLGDFEKTLEILRKNDIHYLFLIGGNGSMRAAEAISNIARAASYDLIVLGIPKTIDNDIAGTDRCPGYASAARYLAQSVRDLGMDLRALPQPVTIYETMGRDVGWLAGAAMLAKLDERSAPHLVYLPERPFDPTEFISDLDNILKKNDHAVIVIAEGIRTATGQPVYQSTDPNQQDPCARPLVGDVAPHLAALVSHELKIRCRTEKPGLLGRSSIFLASSQDQSDADQVGRAAIHSALKNESNQMIALNPLGSPTPWKLVPLSTSAGQDRLVPKDWLAAPSSGGVSQSFMHYARPLVGTLLDYPAPL